MKTSKRPRFLLVAAAIAFAVLVNHGISSATKVAAPADERNDWRAHIANLQQGLSERDPGASKLDDIRALERAKRALEYRYQLQQVEHLRAMGRSEEASRLQDRMVSAPAELRAGGGSER